MNNNKKNILKKNGKYNKCKKNTEIRHIMIENKYIEGMLMD